MKTRGLGANQRAVLRLMLPDGSSKGRRFWYPGCGWYWNTFSGTEKIMWSLEKRGLVRYGMVEVPYGELSSRAGTTFTRKGWEVIPEAARAALGDEE